MTIEELLSKEFNHAKHKDTQDPQVESMLRELFASNPELAMQLLAQSAEATTTGSSNSLNMQSQNQQQPSQPLQDTTTIIPQPGFVIKSRTKRKTDNYPANIKIFINVCHSPYIPSPPPLSDSELQKALQEGDHTSYRVPISLSSLKSDIDKLGNNCLAIDACVHSDVLTKTFDDMGYRDFIVRLILEWVVQKCELDLDVDTPSFPKLKCKGQLSTHYIRRPKRAGISQVSDVQSKKTPASKNFSVTPAPSKSTIQNTESKVTEHKPSPSQPLTSLKPTTPLPEPTYTHTTKNDMQIYHIQLPTCTSSSSIIVEITSTGLELLLQNEYYLNITTEWKVDTLYGEGTWDNSKKVLEIKLKERI